MATNVNFIKIGLTSGTLNILPNPDYQPLETTRKKQVSELFSARGDRNITITGKIKREFVLKYANLEKTDYNLILPYCDVGLEYYVELRDGGDNVIFSGFAWVSLDGDSELNTLKDFDLIIKEL